MALSNEQREVVFKRIIDTMLIGIDAGTLEPYELNNISEYVLKRTGELESESQAPLLFEELSDRWPIFSSLLEEEQGKNNEKVESEVSEGAATLLQHGKVDEALALVKTATAN